MKRMIMIVIIVLLVTFQLLAWAEPPKYNYSYMGLEYETEIIEEKQVDIKGYLGNQPDKGFYFKDGGRISVNTNKGPLCSNKVFLNDLQEEREISYKIGRVDGEKCNIAINVPKVEGHYKAVAQRTISVKYYKVWYTDSFTKERKVLHSGCVKELLCDSFWVEKVD